MTPLKTWKISYPRDALGSRRFYYMSLGINTLSIIKRQRTVIWWLVYVNGVYQCESPDLHHAFRRFREIIAAKLAKVYADVP